MISERKVSYLVSGDSISINDSLVIVYADEAEVPPVKLPPAIHGEQLYFVKFLGGRAKLQCVSGDTFVDFDKSYLSQNEDGLNGVVIQSYGACSWYIIAKF